VERLDLMTTDKPRAKTRQELIIGVWRQLGCESVGAAELEQIQESILRSFGAGAIESPATIARILADNGALLRHPEVLDCDTAWRERHSLDLSFPEPLSFSTLRAAAVSIERFDDLRKQLAHAQDEPGLGRLRGLALKCKRELQLLSLSKAVGESERLEAAEMVLWLTVWLQDGEIFHDWLTLRYRSPEFVERFGPAGE
jgi:hypothetical protein